MFDWRNPLFRFGVCATAGWLIVGVLIVVFAGKWSEGVKPNEWGDVFAGLFAPVAFLWLVLGFVQQGQELKQQTEELRQSVVQQRELVEITRQQVLATLNEQQRQRVIDHASVQPGFSLYVGTSRLGPGTREIILSNHGHSARNVLVRVTPSPTTQPRLWPMLHSEGKQSFTIAFPDTFPELVSFEISFIDGHNQPGADSFHATQDAAGRFVIARPSGSAR